MQGYIIRQKKKKLSNTHYKEQKCHIIDCIARTSFYKPE